MNGVLVVDKPAGPTSHDVVARVRRLLKLSRVGHTGTLDPLATGVLPLVVGRATRLAQFLSAADKEYIADVRLGVATNTYDAEGSPDGPGKACQFEAELTEDALEGILAEFRGTYWQTPPPFSAKKIGGTPAYRLARGHKAVELKPVQVSVTALEVVQRFPSLLRLRLVCTSGFYVRTLAHELGQRIGCGAHLEALRRMRAGEFTLEHAVPLEVLDAAGPGAVRHIVPLNELLNGLPRVVLTERGAARASHGNTLSGEDLQDSFALPEGTRVRLMDGGGALLAIGERRDGEFLQPLVVLV